jgi:hypothetical protein
MLKGKKMYDKVELYNAKTKNKIWEVNKLYDNDTFDDDQSSVGYKINVFQETINQNIDEYLVNFEYLTRVMENYGFQVLSDIDAQNLGLPSGCGLFEDLFRQMTTSQTGRNGMSDRFGKARDMSNNEKDISFKNRYFVFKKIITVDMEKIVIEEIDDDAPIVTEIEEEGDEDMGVDESKDDADAEENIAPSMVEPAQETPAPKKKRTIIVRRPRKLNQSIVLQDSSSKEA